MAKKSEIAIVGRACRFPGASSVADLWKLLVDQRCAISQIPPDRWSLERYGHPRHGERGRSYTWAAGVLDDVWGFDPGAFGMSPREAEQVDPQQRLLLELTWEALEDAGIRPSSLAGTETGVFVGASTTDHGNSKLFDYAATDGYFATGNAASILANRISYIYDLNGPSFTVDTACSSSLVALDAAIQALQSGRIDTAIVGGVSILLAPFQFISFSQATMLSRTGLCQAFSAKADGYVRSEGGAILVLRNADSLQPGKERAHAHIVTSRVNSDGRTNGIALPSKKRQAQLLDQIYGDGKIDPRQLAFVEAHGTGTPVGDPVEASALGEVLGAKRNKVLPIGSIKSNIGHTEAAAGMGGLLKTMLALEHDLLPASLHCDELNPNIDFERLNLAVARDPVRLARAKTPRLAGVSSYGFGGTNSHVVLSDPARPPAAGVESAPRLLMLSAHTRSALQSLAEDYAARLEAEGGSANRLAAALGHRRELLAERLVTPLDAGWSPAAALRSFVEQGADAGPEIAVGTALGRQAEVAFVYSGNGSQWAGMGRSAYRDNAAFRAALDDIDHLFQNLSGWSLVATLNSDALADELGKTSVAQPLIFALQAATTRVMRDLGLRPRAVLGHSVGEVAAAEAAGALDIETAVKVIYYRSLHQELVFDKGGMAVLIGSREAAETLAAELPELSIAAYNSPRAFTFSGTYAALDELAKKARALRGRVQKLDLAYPFHSGLIAGIEAPLMADLGVIKPREGDVPFVSTVTGSVLPGSSLDSAYWWRNVREPVLFAQAVEEAAQLGARVFVEIGPSPILLSHVSDILGSRDLPFATLPVFERREQAGDPFLRALATALARGANVDAESVFGTDPGAGVELATYPWQRKPLHLPDTSESAHLLTPRPWHPLVGSRTSLDQLEWHSLIDTTLLPTIADHVVDEHVLLPGAAFAEMALAAARDWLGGETAFVSDFEIHAPMILDGASSREARVRIQPVTGTLEVMSRPRLSQAAWQVHVTAKVSRFVGTADGSPCWAAPDHAADMTAADLYPFAAKSGLHYGPAFQLLARAYRISPRKILVELTAPTDAVDERYGVDPARADACFHGLALLYSELAADGQFKPYVPVAVGELKLFQSGVPVTGALIEIIRADERTILADFTLFDAGKRPVVSMRRARFQAMNAFRSSDLKIEFVTAETILAAEPLAARGAPGPSANVLAEAARASGHVAAENAAAAPDYVLLEGWATAAAFGLISALADNGRVDFESMADKVGSSETLAAWLRQLVGALAQSGLLTRADDGTFAIVPDVELPPPGAVLQALAIEHPERSAELLLAARTGAVMDMLASGAPLGQQLFTTSALDAFDYGGRAAAEAANVIADVLGRIDESWPADRALRILQVGDSPLSMAAAHLAARRDAELTIVEPNRRRLERAKLALEGQGRIAFVHEFDDLPAGGFDLVIAGQTLFRWIGDAKSRAAIAQSMASEAVLLTVDPEASIYRDVVFGLADHWGEESADKSLVAVNSETAWRRALADMDLGEIAVLPAASADAALISIGQKSAERSVRASKGDAVVIGSDGPTKETAAALTTMLMFSGLKVTSLSADDDELLLPEDSDTIIYLAGDEGDGPAAARIARRCLALQHLATAIGSRKVALWIVCPGATRSDLNSSNAVEAAVWAFARTLANEVQTLDVRLIDLAPSLPADVAARRLKEVVLSDTAEMEIVADGGATSVMRFERFELPSSDGVPASDRLLRLTKGEQSGLDRMVWAAGRRRMPDAHEIEIAVEVSGLNFRDVMWGLSILPDEILEDGYAGATLGLECAGVVTRIGSGVDRFAVGDRVLAFAKAALATHVTVDAAVAAMIPGGLPAAAAATIPVAFLTAYYGLIRCARLEPGESVLIHGGAGGVGLAALQIAKWRGATIFATAGSDERRDLLRTLGADHVFDSRSNQFVDDIRAVNASGVDVVLNSLSGEAMERSIAVLKPFGRFVELGKRDYVANTHIGLKPFRRNLSYFGVDLDQLLLKGGNAGRDLFDDVMALFAEGALSPLPYRVFPARETVDAFRVMQRSGHVGKIVIQPPRGSNEQIQDGQPFTASASRTHLITGGLSGFGLAAARWLVDNGGRHLVLMGRSGAATPEAQEALDDLRATGASVTVAALDVTDEAKVAALVAGLALPLGGVIHAATVYDDALIANLAADKLDRVLGAKVTGAEVLDRVTRNLQLDYFVLFSSATTLIGSPGQGAYVAANAFLEGLARRRRAAGLPALAAAWGAIEDVGILARSGSVATSLLSRTGVTGMAARAALDRLGAMLSSGAASEGPSTVAIAAVNWAAGRENLPILRSNTFAALMSGLQDSAQSQAGKIVVRDLVEQEGPEAATRVIAEMVQEEIARILRLPRDDISRNKPLMEIGLDSLMAVELGMGLEQRFALDGPLSTSTGAMSVNELAEYVVGLAAGDNGARDQTSESLAYRHLDADLRREIVDAMPGLKSSDGASRRETIH